MVYVLLAYKENYEDGSVTYVAGVYAQRAEAEAVIASHVAAWGDYYELLRAYHRQQCPAPKRPEGYEVDYSIIEAPMGTFGRFE